MNENTKNTLKGISKIVLTIMAYRTYDVARIISAVLCLMAAHQQITAGKATFFLVVVLYLFTYPIISAIIYLLLLIPKYISKFILMFMKGGSETGFDGYGDYGGYGYDNSESYYDYGGYDGYDYSNQNNYSKNAGNANQNTNSSDDSYNRAYEEFKRQYNQYYYQKNNANSGSSSQNSNRSNSYNNSRSSGSASDYEKALKFYGLKVPFTEKELKEKRRKMMKTAHPDAGGSTNEAETINQYYDILKKYAN